MKAKNSHRKIPIFTIVIVTSFILSLSAAAFRPPSLQYANTYINTPAANSMAISRQLEVDSKASSSSSSSSSSSASKADKYIMEQKMFIASSQSASSQSASGGVSSNATYILSAAATSSAAAPSTSTSTSTSESIEIPAVKPTVESSSQSTANKISSTSTATSAATSETTTSKSSTSTPLSTPTLSLSTSQNSSGSGNAALSKPLFVGYYGGWAAYGGYTPDKINASQMNVINYAFATIGTNLQIAASDPDIDYTNYRDLQSLKSKYSGLKTVISVGGWSDSGRFSDAALTQTSRDTFADSVVTFIKAYGFDGVDIDWEYPTGGGLSTNTYRPQDKTDFVLLMQTLRTKLDAQGAIDGKHYILSFAGAASSTYASGIGLSQIASVVDYGFIMTYDMHGPWDTYTDFNAPLYTPTGASPQYKVSVDSEVGAWLSNGFPASKLILGVPFYGYLYSGTTDSNNGLWQKYSSCVAVGYDTIESTYLSNPSYTSHYDSNAQEPWLFNGSNFLCYDDASSLAQKSHYAASLGLLGVGAWDISYDHGSVLVNAIVNAFK